MPSRVKTVRQSVTIPAPLAERGVRAERDADLELKAAYERFMKEQGSPRREAAGKDLIRAIFGKDAIAGDTVL